MNVFYIYFKDNKEYSHNLMAEKYLELKEGRLFFLELEELIGEPIPLIKDKDKNKFGAIVKNGHIIELRLSHKDLRGLPNSRNELIFLKSLDLSYNKCSDLTLDLSRLPSLEKLNLSNNKLLKYLPHGVDFLPNLKELDLSSNPLSYDQEKLTTNPHFCGLLNLELLDITETPFICNGLKKKLNDIISVKLEQLTLTPDKLHKEFKEIRLTKTELAEKVTSLFQNCNSSYYRIKLLGIIEKEGLKSQKIFNLLENTLISDDSSIVRANSISPLVHNLPKKCIPPLKWAVEHEKSPIVISKLINQLDIKVHRDFKFLYQKLSKRLSMIYEVVPEEARFFVDLEAVSTKLLKESHYYSGTDKVNLGFFKYYRNNICYVMYDERGEDIYTVVNKHVTALTLRSWRLRELPKSIGALSRLKYLNLNNNYFRSLPDTFNNLHRLKILVLKNANEINLPEHLSNIVKGSFP